MSRYLVLVAFLLMCVSTATAATWNVFNNAFNDRLMFFFDADTVTKKGDIVTMWTKYVNNEKYPDSDGSYSTAQKVEYSCKKRTNRVLSTSVYDKGGEFIRSAGASDKINDIAPDTLAEDILKAACTSDFPKSKSKKYYFPVEGNNIFRHASVYYKSQEDMKTDLAPTSAATWYVFNNAYNDKKLFFFDADTITKDGDNFTIWVKNVNNEKYPDNDGSYSTASKYLFSCSKNTVQDLRSSIYNKERQFMRSFTAAGDTVIAAPGSINEAMLKAVCTPDFPKSTSREEYFQVENNDIFQTTINYYKYQEAKTTDLAPK